MSERDLIERLRARRKCQRCDCLSCGREGMGELHDHVCTDGPDCIETREKLRAKNRNLRLLCGDAADALRDREATIARLSEALAEAEKKGAEVRELPWERRAFGGLWTAKTSLGSYFIDANEEPCEWAFGRQDYRAAGSLEEAKAAAQADYEARVRACLAPPRDLSQGGQHG